jgi:hypothetical protein
MPEVIEVLPKHTGGSSAVYDWQTLLDGTARRYLRGEDYTCSDSSFRTYAYQQARKQGLFVAFRIARDETGDQIGWDLQSRDEK